MPGDINFDEIEDVLMDRAHSYRSILLKPNRHTAELKARLAGVEPESVASRSTPPGKRERRVNSGYGTPSGRGFGAANLRNVRAGGDRRQPRILQSEPVLPRARIRSAQGQAETILLLIHADQPWGRWPRLGKPRGNRESVGTYCAMSPQG